MYLYSCTGTGNSFKKDAVGPTCARVIVIRMKRYSSHARQRPCAIRPDVRQILLGVTRARGGL